MRKMMNFVTGVLCGATIGAVLALLMAPYSGADLQSQIRSQVEELVEKGRQAANIKQAELETQLEAFKRGQSVVLQDPPTPTEG